MPSDLIGGCVRFSARTPELGLKYSTKSALKYAPAMPPKSHCHQNLAASFAGEGKQI